jgi:ABC-2 type transport system permease protein
MISNFCYDVYTVFWRDWVVFKKIFFKFLCSRMITPFLYIFAFGIGLGRNVSVDGGSYLSFLIPGMVALNSMNISLILLLLLLICHVFIIILWKHI